MTTQTQRSTIERALKIMHEKLPNKFYLKSPETTRVLGVSGDILKQYLGISTWSEVYEFADKFVKGKKEVSESHSRENAFKKRLNPKTGNIFQRGEVCPETGKIFMYYKTKDKNLTHPGHCREYWTTVEAFEKKLGDDAFTKSRVGAKERNIEWNISPAKKEEMLKQKYCKSCGVRMRMPWEDHPRKKRQPIPTSFSIDRLDNEVGYIDSNVNAMCFGCNGYKGTMSKEDLIRVNKTLLKLMKEKNVV